MRRFRSRALPPPKLPPLSPCARLPGHAAAVDCLVALPCGALVSGGQDGTVLLHFVVGPKRRVALRGHTDAVGGVALLEPGLLVSVSSDKTARVWRLQSGKQVASIWFDEIPYDVCAIGKGRVIVGCTQGADVKVFELRWTATGLGKRLLGKGYPTSCGAVFLWTEDVGILWRAAHGVHGTHLGSPNRNIFSDPQWPFCATMSRTWFVDYTETGVRVLEIATWREKGWYLKGRSVWDVRWVGAGGVLLVCWRGGVTFIEVQSGAVIWQRTFTSACRALMCKDGRVVVGTGSGNLFLVGVPREAMQKIWARGEEERACLSPVAHEKPMGGALCALLRGECAGDGILEYVRRDGNFPASVEEWACGHWLLMLGLRDGRYARGYAAGAEERLWRRELYAAACGFEFRGAEEVEALEVCFEEAREAAVLGREVDDVGGVQLLHHEQTGSRIRDAIVSRCERVLRGEKIMSKLQGCVARYEEGKMVSVLLGAALLVIGLGTERRKRGGDDGDLEENKGFVLDALSEVLQDLWGGRARCASVRDFSSRLFAAAQQVLLDDSGRYLSDERRAEIASTVGECGTSIGNLCALFQEQAAYGAEARGREDE